MKNLVIANYRSGGYTLHDMLLEKYNCYTFKEIFFNVDDVHNKLNEYNDNESCIAKLCPTQIKGNDIKILNTCYKLCEMADSINYIQREGTMEQVISFAVANKQFSHKDISPWLSDRQLFNEQLTDQDLDKSFNALYRNHMFIKELYSKYKGKVYTLEKDLEYNPYPNKHTYKGDWQLPHKFPMLGESIG